MIELGKQEKKSRLRHISATTSGVLLFIVGLGLVVGLFALISPGQPGPMSFGGSVNVAATAQAIQTHNRQAELESTLEMKRVAWELELIKKQQEVLAEFNGAAKKQLTDLQAKFLSRQSELNQTKLAIQTDQFKVRELQNAIQADAAELTNLEEQVKQLNNDLDQTKTQLQAAVETLARQQATAPIQNVDLPSAATTDDGPSDHTPTTAPSSDGDQPAKNDADKDNAERSERSEGGSDYHDDDKPSDD